MITKQGLYNINDDSKNVLMYNGKRICTKLASTLRNFGLHINGDTLEIDGCVVAKTSATPKLEMVGDDVYFGDVPLVEKNECVNITLEDYNTLISGGSVAGYKTYSPATVYNIVANPSIARTVTYNVAGDNLVFQDGNILPKDASGIYNSASGKLAENTEDLTETINNPDCPNVHVRYFNPVIAVGDTITFEYFVDTRRMSSIQYSTLNDTFTLVVTTPYGTVKKTTYAGFYKITLPAFTESGIKWFSVRCIDSNGVGSEEQFFDVMVKAPHTDVVYTMTSADLEPFEYNGNTYQIVVNDDDVQTAFANKAALSAFFAKVKAGGADKVVMYNNVTDNDGDGTIYWIDYHGVFGTQTYYMCNIANKKITSVTQVAFEDINELGVYSFIRTPRVGDSLDTSNSSCFVAVNTSSSGANISFPNYFVIDLNSSTIAATQCVDLGDGELIQLNGNVDTHIVNGCIKGNLDGFDFVTSRKKSGKSNEWFSAVSMKGSRYCSFENLDISGSVGYDMCLLGNGTNGGYRLENMGIYDNSSIDLSTGEDITKENMIRTGAFTVTPGTTISFGRNGYNTYLNLGTEREFFYVFFDSSNNYIGFIKSHFYRYAMVPPNAAKAKITGYGKILQTEGENSTDWAYDTSRGLVFLFQPSLCRNIVIKNCNWHDTRTTALTNPTAKGVLYENCTYKNIAIGNLLPNGWVVTPLLGDFEDSWQWASNIYIKNCKWLNSSGHRELKVYYTNSLEFVNNDGFDFIDAGGVETGVFEGNKINHLQIDRNRSCYYPCIVYRNNTIAYMDIRYGYFGTSAVTWTHHITEKTVAMSDSKIGVECRYADLLLRRCKNGNVIVD